MRDINYDDFACPSTLSADGGTRIVAIACAKMSQDKAKLIEILREGMSDRIYSMRCACNCCIHWCATVGEWQEALGVYTPVILALGLSIEEFQWLGCPCCN